MIEHDLALLTALACNYTINRLMLEGVAKLLERKIISKSFQNHRTDDVRFESSFNVPSATFYCICLTFYGGHGVMVMMAVTMMMMMTMTMTMMMITSIKISLAVISHCCGLQQRRI